MQKKLKSSHVFSLPVMHQVGIGALGLLWGLADGFFPGMMQPAQAQSITAAADGTGTVVEQVGQQFTIGQGSLSDDLVNLFHSFDSFSIETGESATFVAPSSVQNILARVRGGVPSILNGLLQVNGTTSEPNLFLMNPAGVLFGAQAALNLPANLTVTTADSIGFDQGWWSAIAPTVIMPSVFLKLWINRLCVETAL